MAGYNTSLDAAPTVHYGQTHYRGRLVMERTARQPGRPNGIAENISARPNNTRNDYVAVATE